MDVNLKDNNLLIFHKLKKNETYKINESVKAKTISIFKKPIITKGISSICEDGKHCLFIDYDNVPRWLVEEDYKRLQEQFDLPRAYLFTTKEEKDGEDLIGNYHVICIAKFYANEVYQMLSCTNADVSFMSMPLRNKYRNWILRVGYKQGKRRPKPLGLVGREYPDESTIIVSEPHFEMLKKLYPDLETPVWKNLDGLKKLKVQEYETGNY